MIGIVSMVIIVLLIVCAVLLIRSSVKDSFYDDGCSLVFGVIFVIVVLIWVSLDWYLHKIEFPNNYTAIIETIEQTKELINPDKELNLEDVEIHRSLSELIRERQGMLAEYRKAKQSPFVMFKPVLPQGGE